MNRKCKIYILYPNHLMSTPYQRVTFHLRIYFFYVNSDITVAVISQVDHWQAQELGVETYTMCSSMQHGDLN